MFRKRIFVCKNGKGKQNPKWGIFLLPLHQDQAFLSAPPSCPTLVPLSLLQPSSVFVPINLLLSFFSSLKDSLLYISFFPFKMADTSNDEQVSIWFFSSASIPFTDRCLPRFHEIVGIFQPFPTPHKPANFRKVDI